MSEYINHKNYSIVLGNLQLPNLPKELELDGERFIIKDEFHITLLNLKRNAGIVDEGDDEERKVGLANSFYEYVRNHSMDNYELVDDLRLVDVDDNKTIVVLVKLKGIDNFFEWLNRRYNAEVPVQPTHITLYTLPTDTFGIPIDSYERLDEISQPLKLPEIQKLLSLNQDERSTQTS